MEKVVAGLLTETSELSAEKVLIKHLLSNYEHVGVVGRPVVNTSETINVSYGIGLIQIIDLDEKNQILTTNVWCRYVRVSHHTNLILYRVAQLK